MKWYWGMFSIILCISWPVWVSVTVEWNSRSPAVEAKAVALRQKKCQYHKQSCPNNRGAVGSTGHFTLILYRWRLLQFLFNAQTSTHKHAQIIPASQNDLIACVHFHSVWAIEMDTPPHGDPSVSTAWQSVSSLHRKPICALGKAIHSQNSMCDWVTVPVCHWLCVVYHISPCARWHNPALCRWCRDRCVFYFPSKCIGAGIFHISIYEFLVSFSVSSDGVLSRYSGGLISTGMHDLWVIIVSSEGNRKWAQ